MVSVNRTKDTMNRIISHLMTIAFLRAAARGRVAVTRSDWRDGWDAGLEWGRSALLKSVTPHLTPDERREMAHVIRLARRERRIPTPTPQ